MNTPYIYQIDTPAGELWLTFTASGVLIRCDVTPPNPPGCCIPGFAQTSDSPSESIGQAIEQFHKYFNGTLRTFSVPMHLQGTEFQQRVWRQAMEIPYGKTLTYRELAQALSLSGGARAVGRALGANPVLVLVPCHRVVPVRGGTGGYKGGRRMKQFLLDHEICHQMP